jgi:uncharacterized RDD family membrane protein YckC
MFAVFGLGGLEILLVIPILGIVFLCFAFWVWMLVDCIRNPGLGTDEKLIWVLVIALTHFIGAVVYFFAGPTAQRGQSHAS